MKILKEVTKEKFKEVFFKYGTDGWGADYWEKFFEKPKRENMKYLISLPANESQNRMSIVTDYSNNEYRFFFMTEDQKEFLYRQD